MTGSYPDCANADFRGVYPVLSLFGRSAGAGVQPLHARIPNCQRGWPQPRETQRSPPPLFIGMPLQHAWPLRRQGRGALTNSTSGGGCGAGTARVLQALCVSRSRSAQLPWIGQCSQQLARCKAACANRPAASLAPCRGQLRRAQQKSDVLLHVALHAVTFVDLALRMRQRCHLWLVGYCASQPSLGCGRTPCAGTRPWSQMGASR